MFQVGATCYQTPSAANQIVASGQAGSVVVIGGQSYVLSVASVSDTSITYAYSPASGGAQILQSFDSVPAPCQLMDAGDALTIGWSIALVWLTVYAITFISSYIKRETFGVNDDS